MTPQSALGEGRRVLRSMTRANNTNNPPTTSMLTRPLKTPSVRARDKGANPVPRVLKGSLKSKTISSPVILKRTSFSSMPVEIIETIADAILDPILPEWESDYCHIEDGCTDISTARFPLSALSQTCSAIRGPTERVLYREVHLDLSGWTFEEKHDVFPPASLHLLLRTLKSRPRLADYVRTVYLDWSYDDLDDLKHHVQSQVRKATIRFLSQCVNLRKLVMLDMPDPDVFEQILPQAISKFSTSGVDNEDLASIFKQFPGLKDLHIRRFYDRVSTISHHHSLSRLCIDGPLQDITRCLAQTLIIAGPTVQHLQIGSRCGVTLEDLGVHIFSPSELSALAQCEHWALRSLRIDSQDIFSDLSSGAAGLLKKLPLDHLHISNIDHIPDEAFSIFPRSLKSITFSNYGFGSTQRTFLAELIKCIQHLLSPKTTHRLTRLALVGGVHEKFVWEEGESADDVTELCELCAFCEAEGLPFTLADEDPEEDAELKLFFV